MWRNNQETHAWSGDHVQIGLIAAKHFKPFLPRYFKQIKNGKLTFSLSGVNVFSDWSWLFESETYPFDYVTNSKRELVDVKHKLLSLPTFVSYELINHGIFPPKAEKYIVFINPKTDPIRRTLEDSLNRCLDLFGGETNYSMDFRVDKALNAFCREHEDTKNLRSSYDSNFVSISNGGQRCQVWYRNLWCWICFYPVAVAIGAPYCFIRSCFSDDYICDVVANVTHLKYHEHRNARYLNHKS